MQEDKQSKQHHSLKLGKEKRESSKGNYYIISPRVIIKAIIIVVPADCTTMILPPDARSLSTASCITSGAVADTGNDRGVTNNLEHVMSFTGENMNLSGVHGDAIKCAGAIIAGPHTMHALAL